MNKCSEQLTAKFNKNLEASSASLDDELSKLRDDLAEVRLPLVETEKLEELSSGHRQLTDEIDRLHGDFKILQLNNDTLRLMNAANLATGEEFSGMFGHSLGVATDSIVCDRQFEFSSGSGYPRLFVESWTSNQETGAPWVVINFGKFVMIKAVKILSPIRYSSKKFAWRPWKYMFQQLNGKLEPRNGH